MYSLLICAKITISYIPVPMDLRFFFKGRSLNSWDAFYEVGLVLHHSQKTQRGPSHTSDPAPALPKTWSLPILPLASPSETNNMLAWDRRCGGGKGRTKNRWAATRALLKTENSLVPYFHQQAWPTRKKVPLWSLAGDRRLGVAMSTKKNQTITGEELDDAEDQSNTGTEQHTSARAHT